MKIEDRMNGFDVIWDLGRRCTYACTYCPPHRANKISPIVEFKDLKASIKFLDKYVTLYEEMRNKPYNIRKISFTGGEPTIHPGFLKFAKYIKETYGNRYEVGVTTNGMFSTRQANIYKDLFAGTISYHAEATPEEKKQVIKNIYLIKHWQVNVMFHKDYFVECAKLCRDLEKAGIKYIPRRIGDEGQNVEKSSIRKGYTHLYTKAQESYFADHWRKKNEKNKEEIDDDFDFKYLESVPKVKEDVSESRKSVIAPIKQISDTPKKKDTVSSKGDISKGLKLKNEDRETKKSKGRMCCGGRDFCLDGKENITFIDNTNFYGYRCLVNWYFLYINQETRDVYHHQTCMTNLDNDIAPIGILDESDKIVERLENYALVDKKMPVISCPKTHCGCGMCVDKIDPEHDIKKHNFGITKVELVPNKLKKMEDTKTITLKNRMDSIDKSI